MSYNNPHWCAIWFDLIWYIFSRLDYKSTYVINLHLRGDNKMCLFQWQSESLIIMIIPKKKKRTSQTRLRTCIEKSAQSFIPKANATSLFWNWANADSNVLHRFHISIKKSLKIPKGQAEAVNRRTTSNTLAKRKKTKEQTMICRTLHRKLQIEQHEPH